MASCTLAANRRNSHVLLSFLVLCVMLVDGTRVVSKTRGGPGYISATGVWPNNNFRSGNAESMQPRLKSIVRAPVSSSMPTPSPTAPPLSLPVSMLRTKATATWDASSEADTATAWSNYEKIAYPHYEKVPYPSWPTSAAVATSASSTPLTEIPTEPSKPALAKSRWVEKMVSVVLVPAAIGMVLFFFLFVKADTLRGRPDVSNKKKSVDDVEEGLQQEGSTSSGSKAYKVRVSKRDDKKMGCEGEPASNQRTQHVASSLESARGKATRGKSSASARDNSLIEYVAPPNSDPEAGSLLSSLSTPGSKQTQFMSSPKASENKRIEHEVQTKPDPEAEHSLPASLPPDSSASRRTSSPSEAAETVRATVPGPEVASSGTVSGDPDTVCGVCDGSGLLLGDACPLCSGQELPVATETEPLPDTSPSKSSVGASSARPSRKKGGKSRKQSERFQ